MRHRRLRRRYSHARGHLPKSRLSLEEYEKRVNAALGTGRIFRLEEHERLQVLNGWRNGWRPETIAMSIALVREGKRRK